MSEIGENNRRSPSVDEKHYDSGKTSLAPGDESPTRLENGKTETALLLNEAQTMERIRAMPDDATPIFVTFSQHDPDNPREWPKWKK